MNMKRGVFPILKDGMTILPTTKMKVSQVTPKAVFSLSISVKKLELTPLLDELDQGHLLPCGLHPMVTFSRLFVLMQPTWQRMK